MGWIFKTITLSCIALIFVSLAVIALGDKQIPASFFGTYEVYSPSDWVKQDQIKVYKDRVILNVPGTKWARFTDTNSMDPILDEDSHALEIIPDNSEQINVGDVIAYQSSYGVIVHRVIEKGEDSEGVYYIVKGDNNKFKDPFKVRFDSIRGVVIAVIY
jgi:hypothetical protein